MTLEIQESPSPFELNIVPTSQAQSAEKAVRLSNEAKPVPIEPFVEEAAASPELSNDLWARIMSLTAPVPAQMKKEMDVLSEVLLAYITPEK